MCAWIVSTAWQHCHTCDVCFECSPFVCVSRSVLTAFQNFRACYSPATTPTCQLPPHPRLSLSLLFNFPLWADEWSPGDGVTVVVPAGSLFLSQGIWEVFYLPEEVSSGPDGELFILLWNKHWYPKFQFRFHLNRCRVKKHDTVEHDTTVFQIICAHSCEDWTTCMLPARFWQLWHIFPFSVAQFRDSGSKWASCWQFHLCQ